MHTFEATSGLFHYLVAPWKDNYILNSLEKMSFGEYMYRLLRENGYDRVISYEYNQSQGEYTVCAYDKLSYYSYKYPDKFEKIPSPLDEKAKEYFYNEIQKIENPENGPKLSVIGPKMMDTHKAAITAVSNYGKKSDPTNVKDRKFLSEIQEHIVKALNSARLKTAILFPVAIFRDANSVSRDAKSDRNVTVEIFKDVNSDRNVTVAKLFNLVKLERDNILIFYTDDENELKDLSEILFIRKDFPPDVKMEEAKQKLGGRYFKSLLLVQDDIRNLILRKKIIECDPAFDNIPFEKIDGLAEKIHQHFTNKKTKTLGDYKTEYAQDAPIRRSMENIFKENQFIEAIASVLPHIKPRRLKVLPQTNGLSLERMGGIPVNATDISYEESLGELNNLIGLENVKQHIKKIFDEIQVYGLQGDKSLHLVFSGNPGTGKTEVARLMGQIFRAQGILKRGHAVEVDKSDLVADHVGGSAIKTREKCEKALDGVLFFDEAYSVVNTDGNTGELFPTMFDKEAYETLMKFMEDHRDRLCVICAGYTDKMEKFLDANPGMRRRIPKDNRIPFPDYSDDELFAILQRFAKREGFQFDSGYEAEIKRVIKDMTAYKDETFGNAGEMRTLFGESKSMIAGRMAKIKEQDTNQQKFMLTAEDIPEQYKNKDVTQLYDEAMASLNNLIGLSSVKSAIKTLYNKIKYLGGTTEPGHYVFMGNPGTGKTEVARIMGKLLKSLGLLKKGHVVDAPRNNLVAGYSGQTAIKTLDKCKEALGGILLVDEAYRLTNDPHDTFGREAFESIMQFMEDNRSKFSVIFAGYKDEMEQFMDANPGMASRISTKILFEDYSVDELSQILAFMSQSKNFNMNQTYIATARNIFEYWVTHKTKRYANARDVRVMLEKSIGNLANRLANAAELGTTISADEKRTLIRDDLGEEYLKLIPAASPVTTESEIPAGILFERHSQNKDAVQYDPANSSAFFEANEAALLYIKTNSGEGTGFLVSPEGYALTCNHVVVNTSSITARLRIKGRQGGAESQHSCRVLKTDPGLDIALIKLEGSNFPYMKLAAGDRKIERGEAFVLFGYPFGEILQKDYTTFNGSIASEDQSDESGEIFLINSEAKCGNSGGPAISQRDGTVIGILCGSRINQSGVLTEEVNYIRPIKYFWEQVTE